MKKVTDVLFQMRGVLLSIVIFISMTSGVFAQDLYTMPDSASTRWVSFENHPDGAKGAGGRENEGAKGHPYGQVYAGETVTLLQMEGAGIVRRIWLTINERDPEMLRALRIDMYWDGANKPAVSAPLGDFFGVGLGRRVPFESALFSDPEGRSFNCFIPMPFRDGAKITVTNESDRDLMLLFYDIDVEKRQQLEKDVLYFHTFWNRDAEAMLGQDYEILSKVNGSGRFLGSNIGIMTDPIYENSWWGEGEVKMYIDGDDKNPTLVGTGTEDYVGSAWGLGTFAHQYEGSLIIDNKNGQYAFYRYHVPDPVWFHDDIRVTIQQMGGAQTDQVIEFLKNGAILQPVTVNGDSSLIKLLEMEPTPNIQDPDFPKGWTNFYRQDDVSSTAYFYLDRPTNNLPELPSVEIRTRGLTTSE